MPFVTFTVRRGLSAADKSRLSETMLEAQVAAGYHRADRFHRFLEFNQDDLLIDPRFPDYATNRTDRSMVVEVIISSGRGGRQRRDGLFGNCRYGSVGSRQKEIGRSIPIVAETEQIADRRYSPLNSRAQISDGSARRFFVVCIKNCAGK